MRWMYLNRSNRKLEWEHSVKLRNIGLLITSLILNVTWVCCTHFDHIDKSNPTEEEFFKFELPSSHNWWKCWKITHYWFQFFNYPFYMGILCMERHADMRWMYLNRSNRKLEWEISVKLRNIGFPTTSLILIITWAYWTPFWSYWCGEFNWRRLGQIWVTHFSQLFKIMKNYTFLI